MNDKETATILMEIREILARLTTAVEKFVDGFASPEPVELAVEPVVHAIGPLETQDTPVSGRTYVYTCGCGYVSQSGDRYLAEMQMNNHLKTVNRK